MKHIVKRGEKYYLNKRVPRELSDYDTREMVRISLKTDSREIALKRYTIISQELDQYWNDLVKNNKTHTKDQFKELVNLARLKGFRFMPAEDVARLPAGELHARLKTAQDHESSDKIVKAVLGGTKEPTIKTSQALERFWDYTQDRIMNKSENQIRKWRNPRIKAIKNFIKCVGNKPLLDISRDDIILFRDWWINRVKKGMKASSANKDLIHLKNIIETVDDNLQIGVPTEVLFKKITLKERFKKSRKPLESDFICDVLLKSENIKDLNVDGQYFLMVMAETGARISELLGLLPEDICLNDEIPHIKIVDRPNRPLKTPFSQRDIPLVGYALKALKSQPEGFPKYRDKSDTFSTMLNKFLRLNGLLPSEEHSAYSLRHSFQDRLLSVNAPDRVQAELMGHKFQRPNYGEGATLKQKLEWIEKIKLL